MKYMDFYLNLANSVPFSQASSFDTVTKEVIDLFGNFDSYFSLNNDNSVNVDLNILISTYPKIDGFFLLWNVPIHFISSSPVPLTFIDNNAFCRDVGNTSLLFVCDYYELTLPVCPDVPIIVSPYSSLNGNGSEFKDGTNVNVTGRSTVYTVDRSYMGLVNDNSYTALYDCSATTGEKITVPEALITLHVTTP